MNRGVLAAAAAFAVLSAPANAVTTLATVSGTISGVIVQGATSAFSSFDGTPDLNIDLAGKTFDLTFDAALRDDGDTSIPGYGPTYVDGSFYFATRGVTDNVYALGSAGGLISGQFRDNSMYGSLVITKTSLALTLSNPNNIFNGSGILSLTATRLGNQFVNWTGHAFGDFELRRADHYNSSTNADFRGVNVAVSVSGAPAIPEPATWTMMMVGFGLAGLGVKKRARAAHYSNI